MVGCTHKQQQFFDSPTALRAVPCSPDRSISHDHAAELLADRRLVVRKNGYDVPLPSLTLVWDDIHGKDVRDVEGILARKSSAEISARNGATTVAGVAIDNRIIGIVGPVVLLGLMLFLLAHVVHADRIAESYPQEINAFPDTGLVDSLSEWSY